MTPNQFLEIFISVSLQATVYVALCHCLTQWTSSDRVRSQIWANCHLGLLGLAVIASSLPHLRIWKTSERFEPEEILEAVFDQLWMGRALFYIWLAGAIVSCGWIALTSLKTIWFLRSLKPLSAWERHLPIRWQKKLAPGQLRMYISERIVSPFCWQFQHPVLVVPPQLLDLEPQELEPILRHELAHLEANHPTHLFLQRIVQCVYWFHPAVYWAAYQTDLAREMMCDTAAAANRRQIGDYLRVMLKLLEHPELGSQCRWGLNFFMRREMSALARRARRLTERANRQMAEGPERTWLPAAMFLLVGLVTTAWLPVNVLSSHRSSWSACPQWTAEILHDLGVNARDYEVYDGRLKVLDRMYDLPGDPD